MSQGKIPTTGSPTSGCSQMQQSRCCCPVFLISAAIAFGAIVNILHSPPFCLEASAYARLKRRSMAVAVTTKSTRLATIDCDDKLRHCDRIHLVSQHLSPFVSLHHCSTLQLLAQLGSVQEHGVDRS